MKKYVFYKGLNECGFTVCQEFIDQGTSFSLKALVSHFFSCGKFIRPCFIPKWLKYNGFVQSEGVFIQAESSAFLLFAGLSGVI